MTNLTASIVVLLSTNWVPVDTLQGKKEVGVVVQNTYVRTVEDISAGRESAPGSRFWTNFYSKQTNDWLRESVVVGQANVRDHTVTFQMTVDILVTTLRAESIFSNGYAGTEAKP